MMMGVTLDYLQQLSRMFSGLKTTSKRTNKALVIYKNAHILRCHKCGSRNTLMKLTKDTYICSSCRPLPKTTRRERRSAV